jgi:precorrin-6Y C5,15-methyltransferase (decarboxylating)
LRAALRKYSPAIIPGVSSLNYFFARLKKSWSDVKTISRHGRGANLIDAVRRNRSTFVLTDGAASLGEELTLAGFGELEAFAGENLGLPGERILTLKVCQITKSIIGKLSVLLIENPNFDSRILFGIPDEKFIRGKIPMTKSEIRAVTLSKLALPPNAVCCDVGAGSGSVAVEMALAAYEGRVYAMDKNEEAIRLTMANCRAFRVGNVTPVLATAPQGLRGLPRLDAAFIGGSQGALREITAELFDNNPRMKIVINAVTLETLFEAKAAFDSRGAAFGIAQIGAARAEPVGKFQMIRAISPVFIISGGGNE